MLIFPIVIVISIIMYIYYKVAILKQSDELMQVYMNAKARVFLGIFISFFGINQYLFYETKLSLYITIIFLILGCLQLFAGVKRTKHYANEIEKRKNN
ncbi:YtpI family protein [Aquibacillus albus]|uniref:Abi (CAAX) family protease n=1 Tax=Aquibacillus albus TaxID=1168171 RepID=A0ABS2N410_9BACI|nr:YtpI family protein [Aquibacillus albus]MBM7572875.1 putative Abi (CAAX) family protease [Aquibacillus albus]